MKRIIMNLMAVLILALLPAMTLGSAVYAADPCDPNNNSSAGQVLQGVGQTGADCGKAKSTVSNVFRTIVQILSIITGVVAVFMIIFGGFRYITSGGDAGKVSNAKNTLIYAIIGLAIAAAAQFLVHFVLFQTKKATTGSISQSSVVAGRVESLDRKAG